jgi:hypothetical protein
MCICINVDVFVYICMNLHVFVYTSVYMFICDTFIYMHLYSYVCIFMLLGADPSCQSADVLALRTPSHFIARYGYRSENRYIIYALKYVFIYVFCISMYIHIS